MISFRKTKKIKIMQVHATESTTLYFYDFFSCLEVLTLDIDG